MNLRAQQRIVHPESCFVCRYAGRYAVIWPQNPLDGSGWAIYLKVEQHEPSRRTMVRSGWHNVAVCEEHNSKMFYDWMMIAWEEVWLDYLWNRHIERMES